MSAEKKELPWESLFKRSDEYHSGRCYLLSSDKLKLTHYAVPESEAHRLAALDEENKNLKKCLGYIDDGVKHYHKESFDLGLKQGAELFLEENTKLKEAAQVIVNLSSKMIKNRAAFDNHKLWDKAITAFKKVLNA